MSATVPLLLACLAGISSGCQRRLEPVPDAGPVLLVTPALTTCTDASACERDCADGGARACFALATSHSVGAGIARDEAAATRYFERACELGSGPGCTFAGRQREFARGVPQDLTRAYGWYTRACGLGYLGGCYNQALLLEQGRGTAKDLVQARRLYQAVCDAGSSAACAAVERLPAPTVR